jgi:hypothetical protein
VPFNGEMKEGDAVTFSLPQRWSGAAMGVARGRSAVAACMLYFGTGGGGWRLAGPGGLKGQMGQKLGEIPFGNKIGFLNFQMLWKFVQGELGGILMWGFFLNSFRIFKDFRKI